MKREEFREWFVKNLPELSAHGLMHPNSEDGRRVHLFLAVLDIRLRELGLDKQKKRTKKCQTASLMT